MSESPSPWDWILPAPTRDFGEADAFCRVHHDTQDPAGSIVGSNPDVGRRRFVITGRQAVWMSPTASCAVAETVLRGDGQAPWIDNVELARTTLSTIKLTRKIVAVDLTALRYREDLRLPFLSMSDAESKVASSEFAQWILGNTGANGILYSSLREAGGECLFLAFDSGTESPIACLDQSMPVMHDAECAAQINAWRRGPDIEVL